MRDDGSGKRRDGPPTPSRQGEGPASRSSTGQLPAVPPRSGAPARPSPQPPPRTTTGQLPASGGSGPARTSTGGIPAARATPSPSSRTSTGHMAAASGFAPARTRTGQVPAAGAARTSTGQLPVTGAGTGAQARTSTGGAPAARTQSAASFAAAAAPPPRTQSAVSTPRVPVAAAPRPPSGTALPRTASSAQNPIAAPGRHLLARELGGVENAQQAQQHLLQSGFADDDEATQFDALLGARRTPAAPAEDDEEPTHFEHRFDGTQAPESLRARDLFKALVPPVQSREGRRSREAYRLVLDQFAVGTNPRYEPDAPGKPRAHIFVWDVTRAMGVEVPHFLGSRELNLAQTVDWIRHEGPMKGWRRCSELDAWQAANAGQPVIAMPKEVRLKLLAMARPGDFNTDGKPFLSAAALERGNGLSVKGAFNVFAVEFFTHA